jgi:bifunctional DNA-binding transcriptional regulator/antitoxin component of YhaV-PrlF toxin-antitoxin module
VLIDQIVVLFSHEASETTKTTVFQFFHGGFVAWWLRARSAYVKLTSSFPYIIIVLKGKINGSQIMHSTITSKFQTTIPKKIREQLKLSVKDLLEWKIINDQIVISASARSKFLSFRGRIKTGTGNISEDIQAARERIAESNK